MKRIKEIVFVLAMLFIIGVIGFIGLTANAKKVVEVEDSIKLIEKYTFDYSGVYSFVDDETDKEYLIFASNGASGKAETLFVIER